MRQIFLLFFQETDDLHYVKDFSESGFVFAAFDDQKPAVLIPEKISKNVIFEGSFSITSNDAEIAPEASQPDPAKHIALVEKGLRKLKAGELQKVVLSRKEAVDLKGKEPLELFRDLLALYSTAFVYVFYHPKVGLWLGATPETLLKTEGKNFQTMALAGTQKYTVTTDVQWGQKEVVEQKYVTDAILEALGTVGEVANVKISEPYTSRAGSLLHLRTDISGRLGSAKELGKIVKALHPTPAICGLPKEKAKEFIIFEEGYDREFYTGFLGELNLQKSTQRSRSSRNVENLAFRTVKKESALFVNLRCMKVENDTAFIFVGGGITKDSSPGAEWQETVNKSQTMKKVLLK